jgi:hypothetical protein
MFKNKKKGFSDQLTSEDHSVTVVSWKDNQVLYFVSNSDTKSPQVQVQRYCSIEKDVVMVNQPLCINKYNKSMGGVDRADQNIAQYRINLRSNKWWWALFAWVPDVALQNAWILYKQNKLPEDPKLDLLGFRREVVRTYIRKYKSNRPLGSTTLKRKRVSSDIRFDGIGHYRSSSPTTRRCGLCGKSCRIMCRKCDKGLHASCFNNYHGVN